MRKIGTIFFLFLYFNVSQLVSAEKIRLKLWNVPFKDVRDTGNRGIGVADMAYALNSGRDIRASGELAYHILDIMNSFLDSSKEGKHIILKSTCKQPEPLPIGLKDFTLDK